MQQGSQAPIRINFLGPVLFFGVAILSLRLEDIVLHQVDAVVYATLAKEMALRPVWDWCRMFWNGVPYYEHPPLMKWILAVSIRILGPTTLAVTFPAVIFSSASVATLFLLTRNIWDDRYAAIASLILCLSPTFLREGRNPMMEPALNFFILAAIYFGHRAIHDKSLSLGWICGLVIASGWLTKGPPILIVWPAMLYLGLNAKLDVPYALSLLSRIVVAMAVPVFGFEVWHFVVSGHPFFLEYFRAQLFPAATEITAQTSDTLFYFRDALVRNWPWFALVPVAPVVLFRKRHVVALRVFWLGGILWVGPLIAFSFFSKKSTWYADITLPAIAMIAAIPIQLLWGAQSRSRYLASRALIVRFCMVGGVGILLLGSTLPSIFHYRRPVEDFFHTLSLSKARTVVYGRPIADCIGLDPWRGPFLLKYYLDSDRRGCESPTEFRIEPSGKPLLQQSTVEFQTDEIALVHVLNPAH